MASKKPQPVPTPNAVPAPSPALAVLHRETHRHLRLNRLKPDFGFARASITVALTAAELPAACTEYPCVMARQADGTLTLLAVTGLQAGLNLYVSDAGAWLGEHLPATLAAWPFRLVRDGADAGRFLVGVVTAELNEAAGDPLFDATGAESPWLLERLRQLVDTDAGLTETSRHLAALDAAGVLTERSLQAVLADGSDVELNGFLVVDEAKLQALPATSLHELHAQGALSLAYLHLLSLRRFRPLVVRAGRHTLATDTQPAAAPPVLNEPETAQSV
jgi:hypothetical protein